MGENIKKVVDAQFLINNKLRASRTLHLLMNKLSTERLIKESTEAEYKELMVILESLDKPAFDRWCLRHSARDLSDLPIGELRDLALKKYYISNARRKPYPELLAEVEELRAKERQNAEQDSSVCSGDSEDGGRDDTSLGQSERDKEA